MQAGRQERMAFLFRPDKLRFRKIAGELVLPGIGDDERAGRSGCHASEPAPEVRARAVLRPSRPAS